MFGYSMIFYLIPIFLKGVVLMQVSLCLFIYLNKITGTDFFKNKIFKFFIAEIVGKVS